MKEHTYDTTCWEGYLRFLKKSLDRDLTVCEIKLAMSKYIIGVKVEQTLKEFE